MRRRLFTSISAVSFLVGLSAGTLWIRSYWVSDQIQWRHPTGYRWASTARGSIVGGSSAGTWPNPPPEGFGIRYARDAASPPFNGLIFLDTEAGDRIVDWSRFGLSWYTVRNSRTRADYGQVIVPFWMIFATTCVLPLAWGGGRLISRRLRRINPRVCASCGYDMRATPDRCPECGECPTPDSALPFNSPQA